MQINIGQKIKQLRHRDGRTQEAMASALGVSAQAISRWESSGGYPDMELLPSIANYFHVTIDELFGYSEDRTRKLAEILEYADSALKNADDFTEAVARLRASADEFPTEPKILTRLGYLLVNHGWKTYGARSLTREGSDYALADVEYNSKNPQWIEAIAVFERLLELGVPENDRDTVILLLIQTYQNMGYSDKAIALAEKQSSLVGCRELLLPIATEGELRDRYQGEAIIELLVKLKFTIETSIQTKISLFSTEKGTKLLLGLADFIETVLDDGNCGVLHYHLCTLYLYAATYTSRYAGDQDSAMVYFDRGYEHKKMYDSLLGEGKYRYTAPLVSRVELDCTNAQKLTPNFWRIWREILPEELIMRIDSDAKYADCR